MTERTKRNGEGTWARLNRRKVVKWGIAYSALAWGFLQGLEYVSEAFGWPGQIRQVAILALLLGLPITVVIAWYHGDRGEQRVVASEVGIITLLLFLGGAIFWRYQQVSEHSTAEPARSTPAEAGRAPMDTRPSVAVLPFVNLTSDPGNEYLADGIAETLLTMLAQVRELKVIGRTSSFSYKGQSVDLREIGHQLGARALLEGSVQRVGDRLRITAQLVTATDGSHLWAQTYDRPATDIFEVQDEIARKVTQALSVTLAGTSESGSAGTKNFEAYELFLRGGRLVWERGAASVPEGIALLEKAASLDPAYGQAWAALSHGYIESSAGGGPWHTGGALPYEQASALALRAARRGVELAPDDGWAHAALAKALGFARQDGADAEIAKAVALSPEDPDILAMQASFLRLGAGKWSEAAEMMRRALAVDPKNAELQLQAGMAMDASGDRESALWHYRQAIRLMPDSRRGYFMAGVTLQTLIGREDEALRFLLKVAALDPDDKGINETLAISGASIGETVLVDQQLRQLRGGIGSGTDLLFRAELDRLAGRTESARQRLLESLELDPDNDSALISMEFLRTTRSRPEASAVLQRMLKLDAAWLGKAEASEFYAPICLLAWSGDVESSRRVLAARETGWRRRAAYSVSTGLAGRGDKLVRGLACTGRTEDALTELEALMDANYDLGGSRSLSADPAFDDLRDHPRFKAIMVRLESAELGELERFRARRILTDADVESLGTRVAAAHP